MSGLGKHASADAQLKFTDDQFIWRFSPNRTDPEVLEAIFVGRESLLQNVLEKVVESATTGSKHHVLLYGPRGIGKSHFTSLLHHRLSTDATLSDSIHIAWLNEDETTTSLVQLLVRIYRSLCDAYPNEYSAEWLDELLSQSPEDITGVLTRRFVKRFENRTLVVLVENLNLLFENLGSDGQHELRTLLQEHPFACLIASSQQLFKAVTDRSQPFFGFFQQIPLKPLSLQDAHDLLVKIARAKGQDDLTAFLNTPDGRSRVRAIHDLAGGNHRVYIVLSGFMTRESLDQLVVPFKKMADDLTPYYQERLRWISPQQRQIVELLCRERGTVNPKAMARRLLASEQTIGKQVRKLVEIGYLTATQRGRETFYELSEPLMRLAYEVKEQSLLLMLVDFLRIWYRPDQLQQLQQLRAGGLSRSTQEYADAAYQRSQTHPDPRLKVLQDEIEQAEAEGRSHELAAVWEEKVAVTNSAFDWFKAGYFFDEVNKAHSAAIGCYDKALEIDPKNAVAWNNKGKSLNSLGRYEEALECCEKSLEIEPEGAYASGNKGISLDNLGRAVEAIECYDQVLAIDPKDASAWNNKGKSLHSLGRYEEALKCYDNAIGIDPKYAAAWYNKGNLLNSLGRYEEALECYDNAIEIDPKYVDAWNNKGYSLYHLGHYEEALECLDNAIEIDPKYVDAWNNKGYSLYHLGHYEQALECFNTAIEIDPTNAYPQFNRAEASFALHRWDDGFESIRGAFSKAEDLSEFMGDVASMFSLVFRLSSNDASIRSHIDRLVNLYQQAAEQLALNAGENPLSWLGDGLVKSLANIDADRVTPQVLESYVQAVEQRVAGIPELDVPLRLFRYGIRYLISKDPAVFVELIQPERRILQQALGLESKHESE